MALGGNDPRLPPLDGESDAEETTRAVSRDELIRHQDASFVVGDDAMGDEATLAVAPGQVDLGLGASGMAAALAESIKRESQPNLPAAPAFPGPPHAFQNSAPMQHQPQTWGEPPPWSQPQPMSGMQQQGYDPMLPGGPPPSNPGMQAYPPSGQHPSMQQQGPQGYPMQGGMPGYGLNPNSPNAATAQQPRPAGMMQGQPPWMMQGPPGAASPTKFTPQVILLVAVGAVCLAIFIIGIVLFVTTKF